LVSFLDSLFRLHFKEEKTELLKTIGISQTTWHKIHPSEKRRALKTESSLNETFHCYAVKEIVTYCQMDTVENQRLKFGMLIVY